MIDLRMRRVTTSVVREKPGKRRVKGIIISVEDEKTNCLRAPTHIH